MYELIGIHLISASSGATTTVSAGCVSVEIILDALPMLVSSKP